MIRKPNARRRVAARARSTIAWSLFAFLLTQLTLSTTLEAWRPELRDPEYGHKLHLLREARVQTPTRPLLLALGSSRTLNDLAPRPPSDAPNAPLVFNFGLTRHGPVQQLLALDRLLRDGIRPRWVTLELLPLAMPQGAHELDPTPAFRHTWGDVRFLQAQGYRPAAYLLEWFGARAAPVSANRFVLMSRLEPNWVAWSVRQDYLWSHMDACGWLPAPALTSEAEARDFRERVTIDDGAQLRGFRIHPDSDRALHLSLQLCAQNGIGTAVLLMPEATWFRALYPAQSARQLSEYGSTLTRETGVSVIDARDWNPDADFRDGHHLLAEGAARFTKRFEREVVGRVMDARRD